MEVWLQETKMSLAGRMRPLRVDGTIRPAAFNHQSVVEVLIRPAGLIHPSVVALETPQVAVTHQYLLFVWDGLAVLKSSAPTGRPRTAAGITYTQVACQMNEKLI